MADKTHPPEEGLDKKVNELHNAAPNALHNNPEHQHGVPLVPNANHDTKSHAEKPLSPLEEIAAGAKNALAIGFGTAFPFLYPGNVTHNATNALPLAGGAVIDDIMANKKPDYIKAAKESVVGTVITAPLVGLLKYINITKDYATNYAGAIPGGAAAVGALAAGQAVFIGMYTGLNHIIQNWSFKGLYDKFKKDYWPSVKRTWKYVLPLSALNVLYIYKFGMVAQLAYGSLMTLLFRLVGPKTEGASLKNLAYAMNPLPYVGGALKGTAKLAKNVFYGVPSALYAMGISVADYFKSSQKSAAPAHPQPAAAPAN